MATTVDPSTRFRCFGGEVALSIEGPYAGHPAERAVDELRRIDERLSRFRPDSELTSLNSDPRSAVPATSLMLDLVEAAITAGKLSGGLVDATILPALEAAGYADDIDLLDRLEADAPLPSSSRPALPGQGWLLLGADRRAGLVRRPPGLRLDSGGIAKGLAADRAAALLQGRAATYCVDCAGDLAIGGDTGQPREVSVQHPGTGETVARLAVSAGGVATSGITRRSWRMEDGSVGHHLIDPGRGVPAYTGIVQATALAPTATEAETRAKAALLSGPGRAESMLRCGGLLVLDDGSVRVVPDPGSRFGVEAVEAG